MLEQEFAQGDETMRPIARTYSKLIDLYAKNNMAEMAERTLARMEEQYRKGNKAALPRTIHYTSVLDALARVMKSNPASDLKADRILQSMLNLYDTGSRHLRPDAVLFTTALNCHAKSKQKDSADRSLALLELARKYNVELDIVAYNVVLKTLSISGEEYYDQAREILQGIEESPDLCADSYTYNALVSGMDPEKAESLIQVRYAFPYKCIIRIINNFEPLNPSIFSTGSGNTSAAMRPNHPIHTHIVLS